MEKLTKRRMNVISSEAWRAAVVLGAIDYTTEDIEIWNRFGVCGAMHQAFAWRDSSFYLLECFGKEHQSLAYSHISIDTWHSIKSIPSKWGRS